MDKSKRPPNNSFKPTPLRGAWPITDKTQLDKGVSMNSVLMRIAALELLLVLATGCAVSTVTPVSNDTSISTPTSVINMPPSATTPRPTPSLSVAATDRKWEITITGAHEEKQLTDTGGTRYTPNPGYTFLVVDVTFHNLDASQETKISSDDIAVVDSAEETFQNVGSGFALTYSLGGSSTYSNDQSTTLKLSLVFSVKKENIGHAYNFQVKEMPPIPFTLQSK